MFAWLPGIEQNIDLSLANTGNGDAAYDWTLDTTSGPCQSSLSETQSTIIMGQEIDLSVALFLSLHPQLEMFVPSAASMVWSNLTLGLLLILNSQLSLNSHLIYP